MFIQGFRGGERADKSAHYNAGAFEILFELTLKL